MKVRQRVMRMLDNCRIVKKNGIVRVVYNY